MDNLIADYKKLVTAVKQAALDLDQVCNDRKEALKAAVTLAANLVNVPLCAMGCDGEGAGCDVEEGEEWKRGQREDEE